MLKVRLEHVSLICASKKITEEFIGNQNNSSILSTTISKETDDAFSAQLILGRSIFLEGFY